MTIRALILIAVISALGVSACGKKGPLEPPKPSVFLHH